MSPSAIPVQRRTEAGSKARDDNALPRIWFCDPLCFTPWYSAALARALSATGASVRFISAGVSREPEFFSRVGLSPAPGPFRFDNWANRWPSSLRRVMRCAAAIANSKSLTHTLERSPADRPDLIHLQQLPLLNHQIHVDFTLMEAAQRHNIPVVHTVHNLLPHDSGSSLKDVYSRLYRSVDHLICHSGDIAQALISNFAIAPASISVIPHGPLFEHPAGTQRSTAAARRQLGIAEDRPVILWQGVMAPYKGVDVLLKAWRLCGLRWNKLSGAQPLLLIAGTGSPEVEASIREAVKRLPNDIRADIRYISTNALPSYHQAADLVVYPYRSITTSGALLTGLSYRKPIIASDLPPFREYLRHNDNSLLVEPGDTLELASALTQVIESIASAQELASETTQDNLYLRLVAGAQRNSHRYMGWPEIALRTIAVYQQLKVRTHARTKLCNPLHTFPDASISSH